MNPIAALFIIAERCKLPDCPLADEWINKTWNIHTREYYLALKRKVMRTHSITWRKFEDITLSEMNQTQRTNIIGFHFFEMSRIGKSIETEKRLVAASARECGGNGE